MKAGHEVVAVVTQPDKPKGRGKADAAHAGQRGGSPEHGIPVLQPKKVREPEVVEELK